MRIDLTCPVELWQTKPSKEKLQGHIFLLFNLSSKRVVSIQGTVISYDDDKEQIGRLVERIQGIHGEPRESFEVVFQTDPQIAAENMELIIEKVWFDDGIIWRRSQKEMMEYQPNFLPNGRDLEALRFIAGNDAVGFPQLQGALWVCVCGRANGGNEDSCRRCLREKKMVFKQYTQDAVQTVVKEKELELEEIAKAAREEASIRQLEREEATLRKSKKRKKTIIISSIAVGTIVLGLGTYYYLIPSYQYNQGKKALSVQQFEEAKKKFISLGRFKNAEEMIKETEYQQGIFLKNQNSIESLEEAIIIFDNLEDYSNAQSSAEEARYLKAEILFKTKDYTGAIEEFDKISNYKDASIRKKEVQFLQGKDFFNNQNYQEAYEVFSLLGDYDEAEKYADDSLYEYALVLIKDEKYDEAIEQLASDESLRGKEAMTKAWYGKAQQLENKKEYEEAGKYYLLCGEYLDAPLGVQRCIYDPAITLIENGEYEEAIEKLSEILDYEDSQEKLQYAQYHLALETIDQQNYELAYERLLALENYMDSKHLANEVLLSYIQELIDEGEEEKPLLLLEKLVGHDDYKEEATKQIYYYKGVNALKEKNYIKAIQAFETATHYLDSSEKVIEARTALADQALADKDYDRALEEYKIIGGEDLENEKLTEIQYTLALEKLQNQEFEEAISYFSELGNFKDAQEQKEKAQYAYGEILIEEKNYLKAIEILETDKNNEKFKKLYQQAYYELGAEAEKEEKLILAGSYYGKAGDYLNATAKSKELYENYYVDTLKKAEEWMEQDEYPKIIELLKDFDIESIPKEYELLATYYKEANYLYANQLYNDKKPYDALPYYQNILDYKDVSTVKLQRNAYIIIGTWKSESGIEMIFSQDGNCVIDGEKSRYAVVKYGMFTGSNPDKLVLTHNIVHLTGDSLTLRTIEEGQNTTYKLTRQDSNEKHH